MKLIEFETEYSKIEQRPVKERRLFLDDVLSNCKPKSKLYTKAMFEYAFTYYEQGRLNRARRLIKPIVDDYYSYSFVIELVNIFLLMGSISQFENDIELARYYYEHAFKIAKKHRCNRIICMCLNNIAETYGIESDNKKALKYLLKGEEYLKFSSQYQGALLYLNMSSNYILTKEYDKALVMLKKSIDEYAGLRYPIRYSLLCNAMTIYSNLNDNDRFEYYKNLVLDELNDSIFIDVLEGCKQILHYALEKKDNELFNSIMSRFDKYFEVNQNEYKLRIQIEDLRYLYYKQMNNSEGMIKALESKNLCYENILLEERRNNARGLAQALRIQALQHQNEESKKQNMLLTELSYKDSLTGISNRHAFNMLFNSNSVLKKSSSVVLGIIDLDHFKMINDNYSHLEGGMVLSKLGEVMQGFSSNNCRFFRYGGDEFIVLITNTNYGTAIKIIEEFQATVANITYNHGLKHLSCTIGTAHMSNDIDLNVLLENADKNLYIGKKNKGSLVK